MDVLLVHASADRCVRPRDRDGPAWHGVSDRLGSGGAAALESHVDDLLAVLDAAHARDVCVVSSDSGAPLARTRAK